MYNIHKSHLDLFFRAFDANFALDMRFKAVQLVLKFKKVVSIFFIRIFMVLLWENSIIYNYHELPFEVQIIFYFKTHQTNIFILRYFDNFLFFENWIDSLEFAIRSHWLPEADKKRIEIENMYYIHKSHLDLFFRVLGDFMSPD